MILDAPSAKYALIYESIHREDNVLMVSELCRIAGVSRSGYYRWVNAMPAREAREAKDRADFDLILEAYRHRGLCQRRTQHPYAAAPQESPCNHEPEKNPQAHAEIQPVLPGKKSQPLSQDGKSSPYKQCRT